LSATVIVSLANWFVCLCASGVCDVDILILLLLLMMMVAVV